MIRAVVGCVALLLVGVGALAGLRMSSSNEVFTTRAPSDTTLRAMASLVAPPTPDAFSLGDSPKEAPLLLASQTASNGDCVRALDTFLSSASVPFKEGSTEMASDTIALLEQISARIMACDDAYVMVAGHADGSGEDSVNLALSWDRADRTLNNLVLLGVDPFAVEAMGFGARAPLSQGSDEEDGADRRVDFKVMRKP
jgi:outer membrane protein OmpA-like peptidoglycan-associated protein